MEAASTTRFSSGGRPTSRQHTLPLLTRKPPVLHSAASRARGPAALSANGAGASSVKKKATALTKTLPYIQRLFCVAFLCVRVRSCVCVCVCFLWVALRSAANGSICEKEEGGVRCERWSATTVLAPRQRLQRPGCVSVRSRTACTPFA